jgi:hypothetical protein
MHPPKVEGKENEQKYSIQVDDVDSSSLALKPLKTSSNGPSQRLKNLKPF